MLTDVELSGDRNVIKEEAQNIRKYRDLTIEITAHVECESKSDTSNNGATGTISKYFRRYVCNLPRMRDIKELQKIAILFTAHILREVLI